MCAKVERGNLDVCTLDEWPPTREIPHLGIDSIRGRAEDHGELAETTQVAEESSKQRGPRVGNGLRVNGVPALRPAVRVVETACPPLQPLEPGKGGVAGAK